MHEALHTMAWLAGMTALYLLIPCKYDPAIRLKEWTERKRKERDQ